MPRDIMRLRDLLVDVLTDVPGATDPAALNALSRAAAEFCRKTEVFRKKLVLDIVADETDYDLVSGENARIHRVLSVKGKTDDDQEFTEMDPLYESEYSIEDDSRIVFETAFSVDITDGLEVEAVLRPTMRNAELPEWIIDRYGEGIAGMAKVILLAQPGKPWSGLDASFAQYQYDRAVTNALNEGRRNLKQHTQGLQA